MKRLLQLGFWPLLAAFLFLLAGCSTQHYRRTADKEAYGVIARKTPLVKNMDEHFSIEQTNQLSLDGLPVAAGIETALGPDGEAEREARVISLEQALDISVHHSRIYQTQKEQLFLQALGLTLARHQFAPIFSAGGNGTYNVTALQPVDFAPDPNNPTNLIPVFKLAQETATLLGHKERVTREMVVADCDYVGAGYGLIDQAVIDALKLAARTDGILLDPAIPAP